MTEDLENGCEHRFLYNGLYEGKSLIGTCVLCEKNVIVMPGDNYIFKGRRWEKKNISKPRSGESVYDGRLSIAS